jgi:3'-5' exoribonuclease
MTLGDVSGAIDAKLWPEGVRKWGSDFGAQAIVKVVGRVETYRETKQLVVEKIRLKDDREEIDYSLIVKSSPTDPQELYSDLTGMAKDLQPPDLSRLVLSILDKVRPRLLGAPAARMLHHAYKGGLIEHMTDVTNKAKAICEFVPDINRNMVIAGAILHDIGKTLELKTDVNSRTTEGKLVGHLILGSNLITEAAMELGIKEKPWLPELQHIVLAHHGEAQFGSPVNPLTREALIVHFIDNLDAKLKMMEEALSQVDDEGFTPYNKWLNGRIFAGVESLMEEEDAGN